MDTMLVERDGRWRGGFCRWSCRKRVADTAAVVVKQKRRHPSLLQVKVVVEGVVVERAVGKREREREP